MALPDPQPGLVICYSYLWRDEHKQGQVEGTKKRPCIILTVVNDDSPIVILAPVTHSEPRDKSGTVEIPPGTAQRLGLDGDRSWVVLSEVNQFAWPGFDLAEVPAVSGRFDYGFLPPGLFKKIKFEFTERTRDKKIAATSRDE